MIGALECVQNVRKRYSENAHTHISLPEIQEKQSDQVGGDNHYRCNDPSGTPDRDRLAEIKHQHHIAAQKYL